MFTDVQDETINEHKNKFETWNNGSGKVGNVDLEVQVYIHPRNTPNHFFF